MEKDLNNAKVLAGILEEEAALLRKFKPGKQIKPDEEEAPMEENPIENVDVEEEDEEEPSERGSDAVDRRIEKVMADMRDQGLVDVGDEEGYEAKKVCCRSLGYAFISYSICF